MPIIHSPTMQASQLFRAPVVARSRSAQRAPVRVVARAAAKSKARQPVVEDEPEKDIKLEIGSTVMR